MTEREALNWEPIREFWRNNSGVNWDELEVAIKEALAQPKQEPSFWMDSLDIEHRTPAIITNEDKREGHLNDWRCIHPVYTTPPQRKPLSNQKIIEMYNEPRSDAEMIEFARAIEAAHGIWPENSDCYGPDWTDRDGEYLK